LIEYQEYDENKQVRRPHGSLLGDRYNLLSASYKKIVIITVYSITLLFALFEFIFVIVTYYEIVVITIVYL
jgi:hypothetical protein